MPDLKSCQFCGTMNLRIYENAPSSDMKPWPHVVCLDCGCGQTTVEKWNRRAPAPEQPAAQDGEHVETLRSMVDQQNAALNDAASEIERLSTALAVTLESLDQIGAMTKQSRASVNARSAVVFVRTQLESTK